MGRSRQAVLVLAAGFAVAVGLAACTGTSGGSGAGGSGAGGASERGAAHEAGAPVPSAAASGAVPAAGGGAGSPVTAADVHSTAKIRLAEMTVAVKRSGSVAAQADRAEQIALAAGGEVDADDRTSGRNANAVLVLRVPPVQLEPVLNRLGQLGVERSRHLTTQDVTAHVADVNSRAASAAAAIARLRVLYHQAAKVRDIIEIENELSVRESDLESLQAQQRALTAETATARVTLTLVRQAAVPPKPKPEHHRTGFIGGLENGWDAFRTAVVGVATGIGAILPFLALFAVLAIVGRLAWVRLRPTRRPDAS